MTFTDYALARQQQVEEHIGTRIREEKARENAAARQLKNNVQQQERHARSG